jgi:hypothetical protein
LNRFLRYYRYFVPLLVVFTLVVGACAKFEGDQTIPSYLKIDEVFLYTDYAYEGENSHEITDVWIYVDDQQLGVFELPAKFPVLANGKHKLEIRPGVKLNGISSTRAPYPMLKPKVYDDFEFFPDSVQEIKDLTFRYYDNVTFSWMEDFEMSGITIQETSNSDTAIKQTAPSNNPEALLSSNSKYSGLVNLTADRNFWNAWSYLAYELPGLESPVMLELDFKTDTYVTTGLYAHFNGGYEPIPLVILNHSEDWNHIYINLTPTVSANSNALDFKVFFSAKKASGIEPAKIYLDNIKLIYRSNH